MLTISFILIEYIVCKILAYEKKKMLFLCSFIFYFEKTQSGDDVKFSVSECEIFFNILYSQLGQNNCSRDCNER